MKKHVLKSNAQPILNATDQKCSSCFLSDTFPDTVVDENGTCNHCHDNSVKTNGYIPELIDLNGLKEITEKIGQQKKGKYDCIIGASGGLDSSYTIYIVRKMLKLNPLVVSYDHGFTYDHAVNNVKKICRELDIDLKILSSAGKNDQKYVRSMIKALKVIDSYWGICSFCHYVLCAAVYKTALDEGIRTSFSSSNMYEENLHIPDRFRLKYMIRSIKIKDVCKFPLALFYLIQAQYYLIKLKLEFYLPPVSNLFRSLPKCPLTSINITAYIPWDIKQMIKTLNEQLGWTLPEHPNIHMRFDCRIEDSFINYTYKKATGATVHSIISSNLVNAEVFSKSEMEDAVSYYDSTISERKEEVMNQLGILK